jgi:hypothetical protein
MPHIDSHVDPLEPLERTILECEKDDPRALLDDREIQVGTAVAAIGDRERGCTVGQFVSDAPDVIEAFPGSRQICRSLSWDRSGNQRQFRSSGERHQQRLVPLVSPQRKRTKPSLFLFHSTEERRSPESCSSSRSREQPRAGFTTVVLGCRT